MAELQKPTRVKRATSHNNKSKCFIKPPEQSNGVYLAKLGNSFVTFDVCGHRRFRASARRFPRRLRSACVSVLALPLPMRPSACAALFTNNPLHAHNGHLPLCSMPFACCMPRTDTATACRSPQPPSSDLPPSCALPPSYDAPFSTVTRSSYHKSAFVSTTIFRAMDRSVEQEASAYPLPRAAAPRRWEKEK